MSLRRLRVLIKPFLEEPEEKLETLGYEEFLQSHPELFIPEGGD